MKVRIPGIISSSGKYCVHGYEGSDDEPDWEFLEDTAQSDGDPEIDLSPGLDYGRPTDS